MANHPVAAAGWLSDRAAIGPPQPPRPTNAQSTIRALVTATWTRGTSRSLRAPAKTTRIDAAGTARRVFEISPLGPILDVKRVSACSCVPRLKPLEDNTSPQSHTATIIPAALLGVKRLTARTKKLRYLPCSRLHPLRETSRTLVSMPDFLALQCYACRQFQVCQARKDRRFTCKLCGAKQSVQRIYARATTARPVRERVQALNMARASAEEALELRDSQHPPYDDDEHDCGERDGAFEDTFSKGEHRRFPISDTTKVSRWQGLVDRMRAATAEDPLGAQHDDNDDDGPVDDTDAEFVTTLPDNAASSRKTQARYQRRTQGAPLRNPAGSRTPIRKTLPNDAARRRRTQLERGRANASANQHRDTAQRQGTCEHALSKPTQVDFTKAAGANDGFTLVPYGDDEVFEEEIL